jgi:hypothetical protein
LRVDGTFQFRGKAGVESGTGKSRNPQTGKSDWKTRAKPVVNRHSGGKADFNAQKSAGQMPAL